MISTDEFVKRLEQLFEFYDLTSSSFADKIGVQRSSLSHLLSGRNKPSLDLILKIIAVFPEVDLYWILLGKGDLHHKNKHGITTPISSNSANSKTNQDADLAEFEIPKAEKRNEEEEDFVKKDQDDIKNIIIFYKNGTFKSFTQ